MPENGGESYLLKEIFHPALGFIAGWISFIVGFSAPIASAAIAFGKYFNTIIPINPTIPAAILIILLSVLHSVNIKAGAGLQNFFTILKISLIIAFIASGFIIGNDSSSFLHESASFTKAVFSPSFAIGVIFITFTYSGWNGAVYIAGEVKNPSKNLPIALILGTSVVALMYIAINIMFFSVASVGELSGVIEIGHIVASKLIGKNAAMIFSGLISIALISSISAMIMSGPRVYEKIGIDYPKLSFLHKRSASGGPFLSIIFQCIVSLIFLFSFSFDTLLTYIGFTLSICSAFVVAGVFVMRKKLKNRTGWGYPVTPLIFIAVSAWIVIHAFVERPLESIAGIITFISGYIIYVFIKEKSK